jgi:hypothetical protein
VSFGDLVELIPRAAPSQPEVVDGLRGLNSPSQLALEFSRLTTLRKNKLKKAELKAKREQLTIVTPS